MKEKRRYFNDSVHGHFSLSPTLMTIVDTPCFQRLRKLCQLGVVRRVYPMAEYSRFPHSLGVCHLASKQLDHLVSEWKGSGKRSEDFPATNEEMLCVEVAALCHDIGHGPYSHFWDSSIVPQLVESGSAPKHEHLSIYLFRELIWPRLRGQFVAQQRLEVNTQASINQDEYLDLICQLIAGCKEDYPPDLQWKEPTLKQWWLYQIVANKRCELDVDKFDYIERDCHTLGMGNTVNINRLIIKARIRRIHEQESSPRMGNGKPVVDIPDGAYVIAYKQTEGAELYEVFHMRSMLHRRVYQHKTSVACELMLRDYLLKILPILKIRGTPVVEVIANCKHNLTRYLDMTDSIVDMIHWIDTQALSTTEKETLAQAQHLLERLSNRQLYRCIGCCYFEEKELLQDEDTFLKEFCEHSGANLEELVIKRSEINYCCGSKNPLSNAFFYDEKHLDKHTCFPHPPEEILQLQIPKKFNECFVRVYYTGSEDNQDATTNLLSDKFEQWLRHAKNPHLVSPKRMLHKRRKLSTSIPLLDA